MLDYVCIGEDMLCQDIGQVRAGLEILWYFRPR